MFNHIRLSHSILIWLNLLFLFFITLISFATYLDFKYGNFHIVFVLYASTLTVTGSLLVFMWLHATKENLLIDKAMSIFQRRFMLYDLIIPPGIFMISIGICCYSSCSIFLDTCICCENSSKKKILRNCEEIA